MFTAVAYRKWLRASIIVIYLIIIAGAVVRMTGSGMGCPDWPKCFGYFIPPTQQSELEFQSHKEYKKGMVIIRNESLLVAKKDLKTDVLFNPLNWEPYEKHDYAVFNKYHTWTEYINRLIGALGGLIVLITAIISFIYFKQRPKITVLTVIALFAMLVQAVIGKIVVDTLLSPVLITIHMIVALLIVGLLIYLLHEVQPSDKRYKGTKNITRLAFLIIILTLIQVGLGTQVRQYLDHLVDENGLPFLSTWLEEGPIVFYIHRSYSILLLVLHAYLIYKATVSFHQPRRWYYTLMSILIITIFTGVLMNYVDFPFGSQAAHLVLASIILGIQFYLWMRLKRALEE
jgi:cytochrome c oxidase assembly protein subunit 15